MAGSISPESNEGSNAIVPRSRLSFLEPRVISIPGGEGKPVKLASVEDRVRAIEAQVATGHNLQALILKADVLSAPFFDELLRKTDKRVRSGQYTRLKLFNPPAGAIRPEEYPTGNFKWVWYNSHVTGDRQRWFGKRPPAGARYHTYWQYSDSAGNPYREDTTGSVGDHPVYSYDIWFDLEYNRMINRLLNKVGQSTRVIPRTGIVLISDLSWHKNKVLGDELGEVYPEPLAVVMEFGEEAIRRADLLYPSRNSAYLFKLTKGTKLGELLNDYDPVKMRLLQPHALQDVSTRLTVDFGDTPYFDFAFNAPGDRGHYTMPFNIDDFQIRFSSKENRDAYLVVGDRIKEKMDKDDVMQIRDEILDLIVPKTSG